MRGDFLRQHWVFELAEKNPEKLLKMSDDEFRDALAEAGFDAEELEEEFQSAITELIARFRTH